MSKRMPVSRASCGLRATCIARAQYWRRSRALGPRQGARRTGCVSVSARQDPERGGIIYGRRGQCRRRWALRLGRRSCRGCRPRRPARALVLMRRWGSCGRRRGAEVRRTGGRRWSWGGCYTCVWIGAPHAAGRFRMSWRVRKNKTGGWKLTRSRMLTRDNLKNKTRACNSGDREKRLISNPRPRSVANRGIGGWVSIAPIVLLTASRRSCGGWPSPDGATVVDISSAQCRHQRRDRLADKRISYPTVAMHSQRLQHLTLSCRVHVSSSRGHIRGRRGGPIGCYRKPPQLVQPNLPRTGPQG
jgi:hypothetical protein